MTDVRVGPNGPLATDMLKAICDAGERCSCAEKNYQWYNTSCQIGIAHVNAIALRSTAPQALAATPAVGGERLALTDPAPAPCEDLSIGELIEWLDQPQYTNGALDSEAANHMSAAAELLEKFLAIYVAPPASPLRGREPIANAIREYCRSLTPAAVQNSHGVERIYYAGLSVYGLTDAILSASPPEQPAASNPGEPIREDNDMSNDFDKGDDA